MDDMHFSKAATREDDDGDDDDASCVDVVFDNAEIAADVDEGEPLAWSARFSAAVYRS